MNKPATLILLVALALAAGAGAWVAHRTIDPTANAPALQYGTALPQPQPLPDFSLVTHTGAPIDEQALRGEWTLMFFGFTHCPGVCPATLTLLGDVRKRLGDAAPRVVLVSVDPERDTPQAMKAYLAAFDPQYLGITGSPDAVGAFTAAMGIAHARMPMPDGGYMVDHTAAVFAIDRDGRRAAIFSPPLDAAHIASDLQRLMGG